MADTKVTDLTPFTPILTDVVYGVDDPGGTPISGKFTLQNLLTLFAANINITEAQISDLGAYITASSTNTLTNKTINTASNTITIVEADISDLGAYLLNVVEDTTPQLGGPLDVNGQKIVSTANGNIDIEPNGTGNVLLGNFTFDADQTVGAGQDNYVLTYDNGTGLISLEAAAGGGLANVVEDVTPQLGGDLDAQGFNITDLGNVTFQTGVSGGTLRTGTSAADKFTLQAYDVNDTTYRTVIELDAGNVPVLQLRANYLEIDDDTDTTKRVLWDISGATTGTATTLDFNQTAARTVTFPDASGTVMFNVVEDTTPQLGGSLDVNGQKIVSVSNGNIDIEPNGTGNVLLGNFIFDADQTVGAGQDNYVLTYDNASGLISLEAAAGGGLANVVEDVTPQLGGSLDVNGQSIVSVSNGDITIAPNGTGSIVSNSQVLTGSAADSILDLSATWNTTGTPSALKINITDTASNSGSILANFSVNGVAKNAILKDGSIYMASGATITGQNNDVDARISFLSNGFKFGGGIGLFTASPSGFEASSGGYLGWNTASTISTVGGTLRAAFYSDDSNVIAQRNSTNAQAFRVYNTYTDASNYERAGLRWNTNVFELGSFAAGTGTLRGMMVGVSGNSLGFLGATPIAQYSTTGTTTGFTAGAGTAVLDDSTFTGNTGATAYTIGDVVRALKLYGLIAA